MNTPGPVRPLQVRLALALIAVAVTTAIPFAARRVIDPALAPRLYLLPVGLSAGLWE